MLPVVDIYSKHIHSHYAHYECTDVVNIRTNIYASTLPTHDRVHLCACIHTLAKSKKFGRKEHLNLRIGSTTTCAGNKHKGKTVTYTRNASNFLKPCYSALGDAPEYK